MKKWSKRIAALVCVALAAVLLGACAQGTPQSPAASPSDASYPLTVTDSRGEVTLAHEPQTIVSVSPTMTEILFALGVGDRLVGRTEYCNYPEQALQIQTVGSMYDVDMEKILELNPDLVLGSMLFSEEEARQLTDLGIATAVFTDCTDMESIYAMILTVGALVNRVEAAQECVDNMRTRIDAVTEKVAGAAAPTVYYATDFGEYGDYTAGGDTFIHVLITLAGADNIARDVSGWTISNEVIFQADPQIILVGEARIDAFLADANYAALTAVQEGRVYPVNEDLLNRQGPRLCEAVEQLARIFHPELFQ